MTLDEHLLTILGEECAEVAARISKALRFGLGEIQPGQPLTNAERIEVELDDLAGVVELLQQRGIMRGVDDRLRIEAKKAKVAHFVDYAIACGTVGGADEFVIAPEDQES